MTRKFKRGDLVQISHDLGPHKAHFTMGCEAIIKASYADQFGGNDHKNYTVIFVETGCECSWYEDHEMTFIKHGGEDLIDKVLAEKVIREAHETDLRWIVQNWKSIRPSIPGSTISAIIKWVGIKNPWGISGEGSTYYANAMRAFHLVDQVFSAGDFIAAKAHIKNLNPGADLDA